MQFTKQSVVQHLIDKDVFNIKKFIDDNENPIFSGKSVKYWTSTDGVEMVFLDDSIKLSKLMQSTNTEDEVRMSYNIKTNVLTVHYDNYDEYWADTDACGEEGDDCGEENPFNPNQSLIDYNTADIPATDIDALLSVEVADEEFEPIVYDFNFSTKIFTDDAKYFQYSTVNDPYISMEQGLVILGFLIDAVRVYQKRYNDFLREHSML